MRAGDTEPGPFAEALGAFAGCLIRCLLTGSRNMCPLEGTTSEFLMQAYRANLSELASLRTMLHNNFYVTFLLFGGFLAAVSSLPGEVKYYLFLFAPIMFLLLHYLHLFESYVYLQQEYYVHEVLERAMDNRVSSFALRRDRALRESPILIRQFQGTSRQVFHLAPVLGTYAFWFFLVRDATPWTTLEEVASAIVATGLLLSVWGWFIVARARSRFGRVVATANRNT